MPLLHCAQQSPFVVSVYSFMPLGINLKIPIRPLGTNVYEIWMKLRNVLLNKYAIENVVYKMSAIFQEDDRTMD